MNKIGEKTLGVMDKADWYNRWLLGWFEPYLGRKILEVGCGIGSFTKFFADGKREVCATDLNSDCVKRVGKMKLPKVKLKKADLLKIKFSGRFDTVVCLNVLEHVGDDLVALGNMRKALKKKGRLILLVPAHMVLYGKLDKDLGHFRRYTKKEISKRLKKVGFDVVVSRYLNWWGAAGWAFWIKILGKSLMPQGQVGLFDKLARYFLWIESYIEFPFGLSVFAVAEKK